MVISQRSLILLFIWVTLFPRQKKNPLLCHANKLLFTGGTMADGVSGVDLGL